RRGTRRAAWGTRARRRLAEAGTTIVLTTHSPTDIDLCDRIVFLARDGYLAVVGTPAEARRHFETTDLTVAYERLALEDTPETWAQRFATVRGRSDRADARYTSRAAAPPPPGAPPERGARGFARARGRSDGPVARYRSGPGARPPLRSVPNQVG